MRKNTWIPLTVLTVIVVAGFFILQSGAPTNPGPTKKQEKPICSETKTSACTPIQKSNAPGEMIVESLSRQFLSINGLIR